MTNTGHNTGHTEPCRPFIKKLGTIECNLVETNPVVFNGKLYRLQWMHTSHKANKLGDVYACFIDHKTGEASLPFAKGYGFACAFVDGDTMYVTGSSGQRIQMFVSKDLEVWNEYTALDLPGFDIFNTSICRADDQYVLMFEIRLPEEQAGVPFTARFATSKDMKTWEVTPPECVYAKERYTAPHCLRFLDGYFYNFYLEQIEEPLSYETCVVRSKDFIHWELSPLNPVLRHSADDKKIANPYLTSEERQHIAKAVNLNNSDIDFCEYEGQLIINYSWGSQLGIEFLAEAVYEGSLRQFLEGWYPQ